MADIVGLGNISFEDYFVKKLGLTKDLNKVAAYHKSFKEKGSITKTDVAELAKIAKFDWEPYMEKNFVFEVGRGRNKIPHTVKIIGFLAYGKVLLQDVNYPTPYIIASFKEMEIALAALPKS